MPNTSLEAARIAVEIAASLLNTTDIGQARHSIPVNPIVTLANGTGANQANAGFADIRTLSASATENLDLSGALADAFGNTLAFTKIKAILILAAAGNTNDVLVGGAGANTFATPFADATDKARVKPGGMLLMVAPDVNGLAVTAGTGDILLVGNSAGGTSVTYTVILIGVAT